MMRLVALLTIVALTTPLRAQTGTASPQLTRPAAAPSALPAGAIVKMKLETGVSTAVNKVGDVFHGRVTANVRHNGVTIIPVGAALRGTVTKVDEKRRYRGRPVLELRPEQVTLPNGDVYMIVAVLTHIDRESDASVDNEGQIKGSGIDKRDKLEMAAGAGTGALFGGLATHGAKGTFIGALIGGGAAAGYWLSKRKSASITAGTEIVMELSRPMTMVAVSGD